MPSSRRTTDDRRKVFLSLSGQIEGQLREAYAKKYQAGLMTQASLANKLGVNRSAIHHRLMGHTNMTIETIADMVWGLGCTIRVEIIDCAGIYGQNFFILPARAAPIKLTPPTGSQPVPNPGSSPFPVFPRLPSIVSS